MVGGNKDGIDEIVGGIVDGVDTAVQGVTWLIGLGG